MYWDVFAILSCEWKHGELMLLFMRDVMDGARTPAVIFRSHPGMLAFMGLSPFMNSTTSKVVIYGTEK